MRAILPVSDSHQTCQERSDFKQFVSTETFPRRMVRLGLRFTEVFGGFPHTIRGSDGWSTVSREKDMVNLSSKKIPTPKTSRTHQSVSTSPRTKKRRAPRDVYASACVVQKDIRLAWMHVPRKKYGEGLVTACFQWIGLH